MTVSRTLALLSVLAAAGCGTHADAVCEAVADCSWAGSSDWLERCQSEADLLEHESRAVGCFTQYDAYFTCADQRYDCTGNVASFPGCDDLRALLDGCLAQATADTGCAQLQRALKACPGVGAGVVPASCSATRSCEAHCLLASEQSVCTPQAPELLVATDCAKSCP
jgi:hypothetical protein